MAKNIEVLIQEFTRILSADNFEIKQAEVALAQLRQREGFLPALLSIPQLQGVSPNIAKLAVVYTMTYCRNLVQMQNQAAINITANLFVDFLACSSIDFKVRQQVGYALEYLLRMDTNCIILSIMHPNFVDLLTKSNQNQLQNVNIQYLVLYSQVLADFGVNPSNPLYPFINYAMLPLVRISVRILQHTLSTQIHTEHGLMLVNIMAQTIQKFLKKYLFLPPEITQTLFSSDILSFINLALNFILPGNNLPSTLFYASCEVKHLGIVNSLHCLKSNIIIILSQATRILFHGKKSDLENCHIITQAPQFIGEFVKSLNVVRESTPYYTLTSQVKVIEEILTYLIAVIRMPHFSSSFNQVKDTLIYQTIFKILALNPSDIDNYQNQPQEFVNYILQIVDFNPSTLLKSKKKNILQKQKRFQNEVEDQEQEDYSCMKSIGATLLSHFCKYIDGFLSELVQFCVSVLQDRINIQLSKNLILLILCIIRDDTKNRIDLKSKIGQCLLKQLRDLQIPEMHKKQELKIENIEYSLSLLAISRYGLLIKQYFQEFFEKIFVYVELVLAEKHYDEVARLFACQIIIIFLSTQQGAIYSRRLLLIFNNITNSQTPNRIFLQCIELIIKQNDFEFKNDMIPIHKTLERISALLQWQIKKNTPDLVIINHLWHILTETAQSQELMPELSPLLEQILTPIHPLIDNSNQVHLYEQLLEISAIMVKRKLKVGEYQFEILKLIPKFFYTGKHKYSLLSSFQFINAVIFFGMQTLANDLHVLKTLVLIFIDSIKTKTANQKIRSEGEQCEGILLLQSILIQGSQYFDYDIWQLIATTIIDKIKQNEVIYDFYHASLITTLSLTFNSGHRFFSILDNKQILQILLTKYISCFQNSPQTNLFIISLTDMLAHIEYQFIQQKFVLLLDSLITLLKINGMKKNDCFEKRELDSQEESFWKLLKKFEKNNRLQNLDQFKHFKTIVGGIKRENAELFGQALQQLPEVKLEYFRQLMATKKVNNEARMMLKIRRNNN